MDRTELHALRTFLEAIQRENKFLRIALACSIGDGTLILPDSVVFEPRFSVSQSGNGVSVSVLEDGGIGMMRRAPEYDYMHRFAELEPFSEK